MSGRAGSTDRSAGLLVGRARLSGMAATLVGGDPWVPMSVSIMDMGPIKNLKGVQRVTGCLAALSRFIA
jgi:hypothetical protein